jgi:hypothetical protein
MGSPVLVLTRRVGDMSKMHHPALWHTTGWGSHSLTLLAFLVSTDGIVSYDGLAEKCGNGAISIERQTLLELSGEPLMMLAFFFSSVSTCSGA